MKRIHAVTASALLLVSVLGACGGENAAHVDDGSGGGGGAGGSGGSSAAGASGGSDAGDAGNTALQEYCEATAALNCGLQQTCWPDWAAHEWGPLDACVTAYRSNCLKGAPPGSVITPEQLMACVEARDAGDCQAFARFRQGVGPLDCYGENVGGELPLGTHAGGEPCRAWNQCSTGRCMIDLGVECGTCDTAAYPPGGLGAAGDTCDETLACERGLMCSKANPADPIGQCAPLGDLNDACDVQPPPPAAPVILQKPCFDDLRCDGATLTCTTRLDDGDACTAFDDCKLFSYCNPVSGVCEKLSYTAAVDEACGYFPTTGAFEMCAPGAACQYTSLTTYSGVCSAQGDEGDPCTYDESNANNWPLFTPCKFPLGCLGGICKMGDADSCQ